MVPASLLLFAALAAAHGGYDVNNDADDTLLHHSLVPPIIPDAWTPSVPFWKHGGATVLTDTHVRLTPSRSSRVGYIWNTEPLRLHSWELAISARVHGPGAAADGFVLWYTKRPAVWSGKRPPEHHFWGGDPAFDGVAVVFDTYDNDGQGNNPSISLIAHQNPAGGSAPFLAFPIPAPSSGIAGAGSPAGSLIAGSLPAPANGGHAHPGSGLEGGDGARLWDSSQDVTPRALVEAKRDFRVSTPADEALVAAPFHLRLVYMHQTKRLAVFYQSPGADSDEEIGSLDVSLETGGYIGLTGVTGGLADIHEIHTVTVRPLPGGHSSEDPTP
eukprot:TRINITY_DN57621_c0_g1_i1.p1 TRINITY_DN57621_c0_g1~~TRINITY_DN57621_c0_g1_i1.p1  ORF type:complete len:329 (-),score=58.13 TRINITY_DN57621_c0_g1_i1:147-1133(-)